MSITLKTLIIDGMGTEAKMIVADTEEDYETLKELVSKGIANWETPPTSIVDLVKAIQGLRRNNSPAGEKEGG